ncbi:MAG: hypothetical protein QUS07_07830 [Methanothrix sp.]|nr:hypothetical protein [Methanothrix sp.]
MKSELLPPQSEPFTEEEIAGLDEGEESEYSDPLWESARKRKKDALSLNEYCRRRGIDI